MAEGVETEDQLTHLGQMGCDLGQGYLWSRPVPPNDLLTVGIGSQAIHPYDARFLGASENQPRPSIHYWVVERDPKPYELAAPGAGSPRSGVEKIPLTSEHPAQGREFSVNESPSPVIPWPDVVDPVPLLDLPHRVVDAFLHSSA